MTPLVIDANIAAKWYLPVADRAEALRLLERKAVFHALDFLRTEFASVFRKRAIAGHTFMDAWRAADENVIESITEWHRDEAHLRLALELAVAHPNQFLTAFISPCRSRSTVRSLPPPSHASPNSPARRIRAGSFP